MVKLVEVLKAVEEDSLFENEAIQYLIDYLFNGSKRWHYRVWLVYSLNMILFSIYSVIKEEQIILEVLIMMGTLGFLFYEFGQCAHTGLKNYLLNGWNYFDLLGNSFILAKIWSVWSGSSIESEESRWVTAFALFFGYIKWVSYFTIFDPTRKLVRLITETIKDMRTFLFVLGFIIIGFSFIFVQFQEEEDDETLGDTLLYTYSILYGDYTFEGIKSFELVFLLVVAFALSVVLMNMLIAIMGDTYGRVQERTTFSESQSKLEMIFETILIKRAFGKVGIYWHKKEDLKLVDTYLYVVYEDTTKQKSEKERNEELMASINKIKDEMQRIKDEIKSISEVKNEIIREEIQSAMLQTKDEIKFEIKNELLKIREEIKILTQSEQINEVPNSKDRHTSMREFIINDNKL